MKQPLTIQPEITQGPRYDPLDRLVEDLQNIEMFLLMLEDDPKNLTYLNTHLSPILASRRTISHQIDLLVEEPYNYSMDRLALLHKENEQLFSHLEGVVGSMNPLNLDHFKKFMKASMHSIEAFDLDLTP